VAMAYDGISNNANKKTITNLPIHFVIIPPLFGRNRSLYLFANKNSINDYCKMQILYQEALIKNIL
jgi:hypothetical protein